MLFLLLWSSGVFMYIVFLYTKYVHLEDVV